jgi:hypothetical protein
MLLFSAIIVAAFYRYVVAGALRMQASQNSIQKSNEIIKAVTLGLLGVFSLFLILFTINKELVTGNVGLGGLGGNTGGVANLSVSNVVPVSTSGSGGNSKTCEAVSNITSKIQSGNVCGGAVCTILRGCNWRQYETTIDQATGGNTDLKKMVVVAMCKESGAVINKSHQNDNTSWDCGLMQVNQKGACTPSSYSVIDNINEGVRLIKQKISSASRTYPGVPAVASVFAAYNCCGNGDNPNTQSVDCNASAGFPNPIPKWACPINPGTGSFNMCSVKSYACELSVCMDSL